MTVAEINALLYSPEPSARSTGTRVADRGALARLAVVVRRTAGGAGRTAMRGWRRHRPAHPAAPGFRPLKVTAIDRRIGRRRVADDAEPRRRAAARSAAGPVRRAAPATERQAAAAFSQLLALRTRSRPERYRISVKIEPNGAGGAIREATTCGWATVSTSARRAGVSSCESGEGPVALVSAGIGATPVLAMLHALSAAHSTRPVLWLHARARRKPLPVRRRGSAPPVELSRTAAAMSVSAGPAPPTGSGRTSTPRGASRGRRSTTVGLTPDADVYLCGPGPLHGRHEGGARGARRQAGSRAHRDLQRGRVDDAGRRRRSRRTLRIGRRPISKPGPSSRSRAAGSPPTGMPSAYQSLLELAEACDVPVRWACRTGVCHSCESGLVSGAVAYEPQPLDLPATGNLLICCSRPVGDVVVDL